MSSGAEKRQHHRFMARLDVRVVSGERVTAGEALTTLDIGVGGARCIAAGRLEAGQRLQVSVQLVGGDLVEPAQVTAAASVLRCDIRPEPHHGLPYEIVLQFLRLDPRDRRLLQNYLNSL
ncbi:MAG TPA: PilZ domain-containing protein [Verrucomicrobiae bacterium]|nr:PilZ domain-containing protein [Verrucomicrobiae bacterium]